MTILGAIGFIIAGLFWLAAGIWDISKKRSRRTTILIGCAFLLPGILGLLVAFLGQRV